MFEIILSSGLISPLRSWQLQNLTSLAEVLYYFESVPDLLQVVVVTRRPSDLQLFCFLCIERVVELCMAIGS